MQFQIDHACDRPVYQQIIDQIKRDIALSRLRPDDKLPTVRQLAAQMVVNPNTIAKAYRQLESESVITTRAGAGAFVAPLDSNLSRAVRRKLLTEQLERTIIDAVHMQIDRKTITDWFSRTLDKFKLE